MLLIDIGSASIKIYGYLDNQLTALKTVSCYLKEDFTPEAGITIEKQQLLFELIKSFKDQYPERPIKTYATAIFRQYQPEILTKFKQQFSEYTGAEFNVIDHQTEAEYLKAALLHNSNLDQPVLLINIGGGSTELVTMVDGLEVEIQNIEIGIGPIFEQFPDINQTFSKHPLSEVVEWVSTKINRPKTLTKMAFYSGGELNYMQLMGYQLEDNNLFSDPLHPSLIKVENFRQDNIKTFSEVDIEAMQSLMPDNPKWMLGARPCSAIAQAISQQYAVEKIIPSNVNLIDGVVRRDLVSN